jgi:hypothetical protein
MKKIIINGQALNEVEVKDNLCHAHGVSCAFTSEIKCHHPQFIGSFGFSSTPHCNKPSRIFLRDDQVLEYIAGRLKHGG